ncbi:nucleoside 2-deoxyribosyltransferase [Vagococcus carniphilus]|uniref:Nucleoside 2-deoxyribosyltransferase n=1 Tax=Vagococcus carniphilus TaxID=218144 RepID=A0AAW8U380_9ENTE|nr:nucleoside 2-deoxyribosyltransferase [Vagococcus carniphilus]MDT2830099.1 nucleoside 2-deoxyribosyltransferase [Vagococcus carniphilus]MDT2833983.1 nucleoside 2-deoxyribosyltransferase [Vagococcus carniphilus]MDT2838532.1 nucleoside 2-deoxyribosyltransferase [Vagococcus carniphilus]MDT2853369.1 nucleoside 2-deoxyribosyltransferase [Vagococcus carniphilus]
MSKQIYFASPLFSDMERVYNESLVKKIRTMYPELNVYLPQEQGEINDKESYADAKMIAKYDTDALLSSQLVLAILDGVSIDVGVASEIGVAYQAGIPVLGLFTDSRQQGADNQKKITALKEVGESQFPYMNLYTSGLIKLNGQILNTEEDWLKEIAAYL